jgi:hypothetical protein
MPLTREQLEDGVDEDGCTNGCDQRFPDGEGGWLGVECRYAPLIGLQAFHVPEADDSVLCVYGDYQDCYVEVRVPYSALISNGWTPPRPPND